MALTIDRATIGYDVNGIQSVLSTIEVGVIVSTKNALRRNLDGLRRDLQDCWVGKSADTFMNNMQADVDKICEGFDQSFDALKSELQNVVQGGLAQIDENLIAPRG